MNVMRIFLSCLLLCGCISSSAQIDIFLQTDTSRVAKVMVDVDGTLVELGGLSRDTLNLKILVDGREVDPESRKGRRALQEAGGDGSAEAELNNLDQLIGDIISAFGDLNAGDSLRGVLYEEQALWLRARAIHCGSIDSSNSTNETRRSYGCLIWASQCRLDDLLALYDSLPK